MPKVQKKNERRGPGRPSRDRCSNGALLLLRAAQSEFARHGFEGASLRKIAASAGVDPALAAHHFGSKEALWQAVIERLALDLNPLVVELQELQNQEVPIRIRIETAFQQLISVVCEEPEGGMLLSRISAERGEKLDFLIEKLVRPYHDAFEPLLLEAMRAKVIVEQPFEMFYFMLLHAVTMSVSFRHLLGYFGEPFDDIDHLKRNMTQCMLAMFLGSPSSI